MSSNSVEFFRALLERREFLRGSGSLASATGLGRLTAVLASPILSRLYSPAEFGVLAIFTGLVAVLGMAATGRYELAIPIADSDQDAAALILIAVTLASSVSLLSAFGVPLIAPYIGVSLSGIPAPGLLIALTVAGWGAYRALRYYHIRYELSGSLSMSELHRSFAEPVLQVVSGLLGASAGGLIAGDIAKRVGGTVALLRRRPPVESVAALIRRAKRQLKRHSRFPGLSAPSSLLSTSNARLFPVVIAALYTQAAAGAFALAYRAVIAPSVVLSSSVRQMYYGRASSLLGSAPDQLRDLSIQLILLMFAIGAIPGLAVILFGQDMFVVVFGEEWSLAGRYIEILTIGYLIRFSVGPVLPLLQVLERQDAQLFWNIGRTLLVGASVIMAYVVIGAGDSVTLIKGYTVAYSVSYILHPAISLRLLNNRILDEAANG